MRIAAIAVLSGAMALSGCLATPAYQLKDVTYQDVESALIKGRTTKAQVQEKFGRPTSKSNFNGQEMWTYNLTQIDPLSVAVGAGKYRNLTVFFAGNVVKDFSYSSGGQ